MGHMFTPELLVTRRRVAPHKPCGVSLKDSADPEEQVWMLARSEQLSPPSASLILPFPIRSHLCGQPGHDIRLEVTVS